MPRESIQKQHLVVNKHGKFIVLLEATTVKHCQSLSHNPGSPRRSLYSQPPPSTPPWKHFLSVVSFLWLCNSVSLLKESDVIHFWSMKANIPSCSVCLLGSLHKYLLARKQKCKTYIHFCSIMKDTGNFYESGAKAWASQIKKVFKRASMRTLRLGNPRGKS